MGVAVEMTVINSFEYWEAVSQGISAENGKIELFVKHKLSRGIAREAMLRTIMKEHTPVPFAVRTGFIYNPDPFADPGKQCDILVYDPSKDQPYYNLDEFVVAPPHIVSAVVEVKSDLAAGYSAMLGISRYMKQLTKPMFAFAYTGWTFDYFCKKLAESSRDIEELPECIAVHEDNYIGMRASQSAQLQYFAIDFSKAAKPGVATAHFLASYRRRLDGTASRDGPLWQWFALDLAWLPPESKRWFGPDGIWHDASEIKPDTA
jgi:hypothetical protein